MSSAAQSGWPTLTRHSCPADLSPNSPGAPFLGLLWRHWGLHAGLLSFLVCTLVFLEQVFERAHVADSVTPRMSQNVFYSISYSEDGLAGCGILSWNHFLQHEGQWAGSSSPPCLPASRVAASTSEGVLRPLLGPKTCCFGECPICTRKECASVYCLIQIVHIFACGCSSCLCAERSWSRSLVICGFLFSEAMFLVAYVFCSLI